MTATANTTMLADLIDPQVIADYIDTKLINAIRLSPLARIDNTLVGRPGDEVTLPAYTYVGDAVDVAEGADIPIAKLAQTTEKVKISKMGRAIEFTDEAILSGYNNDVPEEAAKQVVVAINSGVEGKLLTAMNSTATLTDSVTLTSSTDPADAIADALTKFGEDIDGDKVLMVSPAVYGAIRKSRLWIPNTEIGADAIIRGTVGMIHGCQIITSNRLAASQSVSYALTSDSSITSGKTYYTKVNDGTYAAVATPVAADLGKYYEQSTVTANLAYIVKPGALAIFMKRDTLVEFDRDILAETNYIKASKLFAPYVYDKSKLIKLAVTIS